MKTLLVLVLAILCSLAGIVHIQPQPKPVASIEQKATHMIAYGDGGLCTGTAIGPHAVMTATHCDEDGKVKEIRLDLSRRKYHIQKVLTDERDHDIYLIDGPEFTNYVEYKVRPARVGEPVYLYGDGRGQYPSRRLDGVAVDFDDPSDVDAAAGEAAFSLRIIPGDSGSAVFGADGEIVGITTYGWHEQTWDEMEIFSSDSIATVDFTPAFTDEQIKEATSYVPTSNSTAPVQLRLNFEDFFKPLF